MKMKRHIIGAFLLASVTPIFAQIGAPDHDSPADQCRKLLIESAAAIDSGEYDAALVFLDSVFRRDPSYSEAYYYKAMILGWRGDTTAAMELLANGIEKSSQSAILKLLLTRFLVSRRSYDKAWELIDSILAVNPQVGEALYLKGVILREKGDTVNAVKMFQKALEISAGRLR